MQFFNKISEANDIKPKDSFSEKGFTKEMLDRYDKLMGDDVISDTSDNNTASADAPTECREPNSKYEFNGDIYETDDTGTTYKKNGTLLPNIQYTKDGHTYKTDELGRIISCDGMPQYTNNGERNTKEQQEAGGSDRHEQDDGGHIIARIFNGPEGSENLIAMRLTINRGDYKKMENEIAKALQEGKTVTMHVEINYCDDSKRPSKIKVEYIIDNKKTVIIFDNDESSSELLDSLSDLISSEDFDSLKQEIEDMSNDGIDASILSVKIEYNENGEPIKVTVCLLNESTKEKTSKTYEL